MNQNSVEKTTFITHIGTFAWLVMSFGLRNAPSTCVRAMNIIFSGLNRLICYIYLDDLITFSVTYEEHITRLETLFKRMEEHGLKLRPEKCHFAMNKVSYLGHEVTGEGIRPDPERVAPIRGLPAPKTVTEIKQFLGLCSFFRRFIQGFALIAEPLVKLTRKDENFVFGPTQQLAFELLKERLLSPPILGHYDPDLPLELRTDACTYGIAGELVQYKEKKPVLIQCVSRTLTKAERNYSITHLECLAIVYSVDKLRHFLHGTQFVIKTDHHALCWLMKVKDPNGRLCRWALRMMEYDFKIVYNSNKNHGDVDCLSRFPLDMKPDEDISADIPYCGIMATDIQPQKISLLEKTSNVAELQRADAFCIKYLDIFKSTSLSKNEIRRQTKNFVIFDEVLYRRTYINGLSQYLLVVPVTLIPTILESCHDSPYAGHLGVKKTLARIRERFYWRNMVTEITDYVKSCDSCQRRKISPTVGQGLYQPMPIAERIFEAISIDLLGPLPEVNGFKYCVVITDQLSRMSLIEPIKSGHADEVLRVLKLRVFLRFGTPLEIIADRGTNVSSPYCEQFYTEYGIKLKRTTAYHPRSNGVTENFNKVLGHALAIFNQKHENWPELVPYIEFAYNTSVHQSTGFSPHYIVYGQQPRMTIENKLGVKRLVDSESLFQEMIYDRLENIRKKARQLFQKRQTINQEYANQNRREIEFECGDEVLLMLPHSKKLFRGKLLDRYSGTWIVLRKLSPNTYLVMSSKARYRTDIVNVERMKIYHPRNPAGGKINLADTATQTSENIERSVVETTALRRSSWIRYRREPITCEKETSTEEVSYEVKDPTGPETTSENTEQPLRRSTRTHKPNPHYSECFEK
jgi:hypothetical protein